MEVTKLAMNFVHLISVCASKVLMTSTTISPVSTRLWLPWHAAGLQANDA
jgi:hypothetical protein